MIYLVLFFIIFIISLVFAMKFIFVPGDKQYDYNSLCAEFKSGKKIIGIKDNKKIIKFGNGITFEDNCIKFSYKNGTIKKFSIDDNLILYMENVPSVGITGNICYFYIQNNEEFEKFHLTYSIFKEFITNIECEEIKTVKERVSLKNIKNDDLKIIKLQETKKITKILNDMNVRKLGIPLTIRILAVFCIPYLILRFINGDIMILDNKDILVMIFVIFIYLSIIIKFFMNNRIIFNKDGIFYKNVFSQREIINIYENPKIWVMYYWTSLNIKSKRVIVEDDKNGKTVLWDSGDYHNAYGSKKELIKILNNLEIEM